VAQRASALTGHAGDYATRKQTPNRAVIDRRHRPIAIAFG
jgi:hypothetical protein